jgi:hypothetical protein
MNRMIRTAALLTGGILISACSGDTKVELFNGKDLDNWMVFLGDSGTDPAEVFRVEDGTIYTTGKPNGYIRTRESYSNYKLHLEWRWVKEPTNSGVLINVRGEDRLWPHCVECQLMHEHAGDLVLMGKGAGITVRDSAYLVTSEEKRYMVLPKFEDVSENPPGEWNSYDITSLDGRLEVEVNGVLQHEGSDMTPAEGNILLQSEGSPIQFRNIYLELL